MNDLGFFTSLEDEPQIQYLRDSLYEEFQVEVAIKREDQSDTYVSGNKFRKLKYNVLEAAKQQHHTLLTFGGAYSNHIAAVAKAGSLSGFKTIGLIRGKELAQNFRQTLQHNPTLRFAKDYGMQFKFVSREAYREKLQPKFLQQLKDEFGTCYLIPEGGTNTLAVQGCTEILSEATQDFDYILCPVGTGGTIAGIIEGSFPHQKILGFPALKGDFLNAEIKKYTAKTNWELVNAYHFGGYAKVNQELVTFINDFKKKHDILLDPVYTGKMMFGLRDLIRNGFFSKNTRILAVHTGGLQGIAGMNQKLLKKGFPLIRM